MAAMTSSAERTSAAAASSRLPHRENKGGLPRPPGMLAETAIATVFVTTTVAAVAVVAALGAGAVAVAATIVVDYGHGCGRGCQDLHDLFATLIVSTIECVKVQMPS